MSSVFDPVAVAMFWIPLGILTYHWVVFPALLWCWGRLRPRRDNMAGPRYSLSVSLVMAVHNEERVIAEKMRNSLALDYPADKVEILIGSDNSTDRTEELVRSFPDPRIRLFHYEPQAGKTVVQNRLFLEAKGDAVLCTDADCLLAPEALLLMVEHMRDPKVAVVNPKYVRLNERGNPAESLYDKWETKVKELEGRLGTTIGCYGAALLARRAICQPLPADTVLDDLALGIRALRLGYSVVLEPAAAASGRVEAEKDEFRRRVRIGRGNLQALVRSVDMLSPKWGLKSLVYFSHKVVRLLVPFLLLSITAGSVAKMPDTFFAVALALQSAVYVTIPLVLVAKGGWRKLLLPQYYLYHNIGLVVGYWHYFFKPGYSWTRTPRT